MIRRHSNPYDLRLKCSDCGNNGKPFSKDTGSTVVFCHHCDSGWDGYSGLKEQEIYNAKKKA